MKVKVLIADKFPEEYIQQLKDSDLEVIYSPKLGENDLPEAAKDVDILIVRSTIVNADTINKSTHLNLIIRAGAGVNNINISAANQKGIYVANCPGMNSIAVAELAMGLIISLDRRIPDNVADFRSGKWNKGEYSKAEGLFGKNLALVGFGNIGKEVAKRAVAFGMNVYAKDITRIEGEMVKDFSEMDQVLPICDIISIHLPSTPQTKGLFNKQMFSYLKPGALLINTSRQDIIDEDALLEAIKEKNIRVAVDVFKGEPEGKTGEVKSKLQSSPNVYVTDRKSTRLNSTTLFRSLLEAIKEKNIRVAVDVFKGEPEGKTGEVKSKLQSSPNVYVTHHIGASTEQAQIAVAAETVRIIKSYLHS